MEENNAKVYIQKEDLWYFWVLGKKNSSISSDCKNELYWNERKELVKKPA